MTGRVYPLMSITADFTAGPPALPGVNQVSLLPTAAHTGAPAVQGWSTTRGRQYELDVVQAGTASLDMTDVAEFLNPVNAASPFNTGGNQVLPYRCVQIGAWWNSTTNDVTGNLLNATNSAAIGGTFNPYDPSFETSLSFVGVLSGAPTLALSGLHFFRGTKSLAIGFTGASDLPGFGMLTSPGQTYTMSAYVFVPAGVTVQASFTNFPGALGTTIASATSTVSGAWQRLVMTGVPTGCVSVMSLQQVTGGFPQTVYLDAIQLELGAAASTWTATGPTFNAVYTGYIERYPQRWDMAGFRGMKPLESVDALSPLSRTVISQSYAATIAADGPAIFAPLDDDAAPQAVQRPTGGQPFVGYTQLGTDSGAVNFAGDSFLDGSKAVSVVQQNADPVTTVDNSHITYLGTRQGDFSMNPQSFTIEAWIKFSSGVVYLGMGAPMNTIGAVIGPLFYIGWFTSGGRLTMRWTDPNGSTPIAAGFANPLNPFQGWPDGQWHYIALEVINGTSWSLVNDSRVTAPIALGATPSVAISLNNLFAEATTYFGDPVTEIAVANMAVYRTQLSPTQFANHYQRGIGYLGEMSGARALRLLTQYWSTNVVTDTGKTAMAQDFSYDGRNMLDVLQEIADTENGLCWVDVGGFVHQDSRETRYTNATSTTAQFVFGENTAGGELSYEDVEYDYDPTYVYSEADLTAGGSGTTLAPIVNATSQAAYGQRILSKTLQMANDWDVQQAGQFYVQRYAKPAGAPGTTVPPRITTLTLNPAANPALWTAVLTLDIGYRITVKRRTSAGVLISGDYYVENIAHNASADASTWTVSYQLSPVFVPKVWKLGDSVAGVLGSTTVCVY